VNAMTRHTLLATAMAGAAIGSAGTLATAAQESDELRTITARVHGTFEDHAGGLGVVSGDMTITRFEVLNGSVTAIGRIVGAMADSAGAIIGPVARRYSLIGHVAAVGSPGRCRTPARARDGPLGSGESAVRAGCPNYDANARTANGEIACTTQIVASCEKNAPITRSQRAVIPDTRSSYTAADDVAW